MVKIFADTLSSLTVEEAESLGIPLFPQIVVFGEKSYRDDTEITPEEFLSKLVDSNSLPQTAAPPPSLYPPLYETALKNHDTVIVVCPSGKLSGTVRSAEVGAQELPEADIRVFDTKTLAPALGSLVKSAVKWAEQGLSADDIIAKLDEMSSRQKSFFIVDTLEYLQKGGRIGKAEALLGSVLQIKPILGIEDGSISAIESQRTKKKALARLEELVKMNFPKNHPPFLTVSHGGAPEAAKKLASDLASLLNINVEEIPIYHLPPAILVHAGPGVLCVQFFSD